MRLALLLILWFASITYSLFDAYHPHIPCDTDSECMRLNGGDGSPNEESE